MKIYRLPSHLPAPALNDVGLDVETLATQKRAHQEALKSWLVESGWSGPNTGRVLRVPMGDGLAQYMYADGAQPGLVRLPYGDAWNSQDVRFLPPKEVVRRMDAADRVDALFARAG